MTQWSPQQDLALNSVADWYENERSTKQVYRLFGWAGTGKTTLARHFAEGIHGDVKFATFTGKAAHVMASKGCKGASTIHKLIYRPKLASKAHMWELEEQLEVLEAKPEPDFEAIARIREQLTKEQENVGRMNFSLNLESDLRFAKLLIIDEVSMVNEMMGEDLESYGVPILVLGDPEQLPPVYGTGHFTDQEPDIMLTEIHRQALDNPIIAMSKIVREGGSLSLGSYGNSKVIDRKMEAEDILRHDIILTGLRRTKKACDDKAREILGYSSTLPMKGDRLMCVKNNHFLGLLNGQMWKALSDATDMGGEVSLHIGDADGVMEDLAVVANEKLLLGQELKKWEREEEIQEFEYAYAITVHKSQGSQWNNVLLFDQRNRFPNWSERDKRRWLYTGITRAAENITVMRL